MVHGWWVVVLVGSHTEHGFLISWSPRETKVPNKIQKQNAKWVKRLNERLFAFFSSCSSKVSNGIVWLRENIWKGNHAEAVFKRSLVTFIILIGWQFIRIPTKEIIVMNLSPYRYTYIQYIYISIYAYMHICTEHNNQGVGVQMTSSTTGRTCLWWWWWWSVSSHPSQVLPGRFYRGLHEQKSPGFHAEKPHVSGWFLLRNEPTKRVTHPRFKKFCPGNPRENSPQNIPWVESLPLSRSWILPKHC